MPADQQSDGEIVLRGVHLPASAQELPAPPAGEVIEEVPPSLLEELTDLFDDKCKRDVKIRRLAARLVEMNLEMQEARAAIKFRQKILRRVAVDTIRQRHGIKIIPGHNDPDTAYRKDVARIPKTIQKMLDEMGVVLPSSISPTSHEPSPSPVPPPK